MPETVIVVEYYESRYGVEERRLYKVFSSLEVFEEYCLINNIKIMRGAFGVQYFDDVYNYSTTPMNLIQST